MIELEPVEIAEAIGASGVELGDGQPHRVVIDSREAGPGDLFFGLPGTNVDGGDFGASVLENGAWGVVVARNRFTKAAQAATTAQSVFAVEDPVRALGALAGRWRGELGAAVIGVTGSTGKTTTKDIVAAIVGRSKTVVATPANYNTEIGLPLTILGAPPGTDVLVLEMAMRGAGQIAELAAIAGPDVGCIVNVGPVHLEQLGSIEAVAAAKAELIAGLRPGAAAVTPEGEALLAGHLRDDLRNVTFGAGGDVRLLREDSGVLTVSTPEGEFEVEPSFKEDYLVHNLLAAVACAQLVGAAVSGPLDVRFSALRGEVMEVLGGVTLINDCYNANPESMRAALANLARAEGRTIAVLGGMAELGPDADRYHHEVAAAAAAAGVGMLIAVGELAGAYGDEFVGEIEHVVSPAAAAHVVRRVAAPGDTVLVKGSRSVGLEAVAEVLVNLSNPLGSTRLDDGAV